MQLWPEHFDVGTTLDLGDGVNLGFSPGDAFSEDPYVYVGPWGPAPRSDGSWTVAVRGCHTRSGAHGAAGCLSFIRTGLERLA